MVSMLATKAVHVGAPINLALTTTHGRRAEAPVRKGLAALSCSEGQDGCLAPRQFAACEKEAAAFDVEQTQPNADDQHVADDLDEVHSQADRLGSCAKKNRRNCHDNDGDDGLNAC